MRNLGKQKITIIALFIVVLGMLAWWWMRRSTQRENIETPAIEVKKDSVKKDTETAFRLLRDDNSIIVWHDYALDPETIRWDVMAAILDGTPADKRDHIYHISNTLCAVYLPENLPTKKLVPYEKPDKYFKIDIQSVKL